MVIAKFEDVSSVHVSGLWQWDYGQVLRIQGLNLPMAAEIHFSLRETGGEAVTRIGVTKDGVTDVVIPDSMLENSGVTSNYNIYAFVYLTDENSGQTEYKITLSVKARPKPEAFDTPEEAELFREAIAVVNESAGRAEDAQKSAEAWAHGHEDHPERAQDNAMYYAGVAQEGASQTAKDKTEVQRLARQVFQAESTVDADKEEVERLRSQAQAVAESALQSEQNAKASEEASKVAEVGAEAAGDQAALYARQTEADMNTVKQAKAVIMQAGEEVTANKEAVEQTVINFALTAQEAVDDVNAAGQAQIENIQTAGAGAVANVQAAAAEIISDRDQIELNRVNIIKSAIVGEAEGKSILLKDSSESPIITLKEYGYSKQNKTTGAQLYNIDAAKGSLYPVQAGSNGYYEFDYDNTDSTNVAYLNFTVKPSELLEPGRKYLVMAEIKEIAGCELTVSSTWTDNDTQFIGQSKTRAFFDSIGTKRFILETIDDFSVSDCMLRSFVGVLAGEIGHCVCRLSVIKDLTITSDNFVYEPYTGGIPSPNPEYPQELVSAGDKGNITATIADSANRTQTLIMQIPNGLPGIPVTSGGNYTDESGQQWIADYRDWGRGVDVQMVASEVPKTTFEVIASTSVVGRYAFKNAFKNLYKSANFGCLITHGTYKLWSIVEGTWPIDEYSFYYFPGEETTVEEVREKIIALINSDTPLMFLGQLETPIETPIPAEELDAYHALHTNKTTTTIVNDEDVYTEVEYVADAETYINNNYVLKDIYAALEERVAALEVNAIS